MLGGIFPTIGAGAHAAGPSVILAYVLSGLVSLCVALCYAEFASMVPVAGSAYTYAYATLGELVAWIIGWDLILEYGLSLAPTASSLSDYFQHLIGNVGFVLPAWAQTANLHALHPQVDLVAAIVTLAVTLLVAIGIRESAGVNGALVVVQLVAMVVFIVAVAHAIQPSNLHPFAPFGYHGVLASTALVFFAYIGFDTVTVASEEAKRPERDVPIGIILALSLGGSTLRWADTLHGRRAALRPALRRRGDARCARGGDQKSRALLDCRHRRPGGKCDGDADLAARSGAHLLRDGARPDAAAGRRYRSITSFARRRG